METFENALISLINRFSLENGSDTPDFILAGYLQRCLDNWNQTMRERKEWYTDPDAKPLPGSG